MKLKLIVVLAAIALVFPSCPYRRSEQGVILVHEGEKTFNMEGLEPVTYFPGLNIHCKPVQNRFYRNDGFQVRIAEHSRRVLEEAGIVVADNALFNDKHESSASACWNFNEERDNMEKRIVIVFYLPTIPVMDAYNMAYEDMRAIQALEIKEGFEQLTARLQNFGYDIRWEDFTDEEQANIAGILRLMELKMLGEFFQFEDIIDVVNSKLIWIKMQHYNMCYINEYCSIRDRPSGYGLFFILLAKLRKKCDNLCIYVLYLYPQMLR